VICFGQSSAARSEIKSDSVCIKRFEIVKFDGLNISQRLFDSWKVKKTEDSKSVLLQHKNSKSTISIYQTDVKAIVTDLLSRTHNKSDTENSDSVSTELLVGKLNEIDSLPNGKFKFSMMYSIIEADCEVIIAKLIISNQGVIARAKIGVDCVDCKKEFECMIESINNLK
jgi:hypothetical protein